VNISPDTAAIIGVPAGRQEYRDGTMYETCPECGREIVLTERKDFESFTGKEYADHWLAEHTQVAPPTAKDFTGYTDEELHAAFDKVKNKRNWKERVDAVIDEKDLDVTTEAIIYFTGSMPDIVDSWEWPRSRRAKGKVRIVASGYYEAVGA